MPLNQFFTEGYYVHMRAGWVQKPNSKILQTRSSCLPCFTWKFAYFKNVNRFLFNLSDFNWQEDHLMLMFSAHPNDIFGVRRWVGWEPTSNANFSKKFVPWPRVLDVASPISWHPFRFVGFDFFILFQARCLRLPWALSPSIFSCGWIFLI